MITTTRVSRSSRRVTAATAALMLALGLSACSSDASTNDAEAQTQASQVELSDMWVKAADSGMSAAFGTLTNTGDSDVRVTEATSNASPTMELHETVEQSDGTRVMRQKDGGFPIPAHASYQLEPGANHLMLMNVETPVQPGDTVDFTLTFEDSSTLEFSATAKAFTGADEKYVTN